MHHIDKRGMPKSMHINKKKQSIAKWARNLNRHFKKYSNFHSAYEKVLSFISEKEIVNHDK